ncbi:MAG TPA: 3-hydroxyacyl-CoA dehydrogenase NAD-binding domain-containing protein, partial [Casimicrobiaceae bacterium]
MDIQRVGVIGAGTMGNGIAQACAAAGIDVVMVDVGQAQIDRGLATIDGSLERLQKKDKITGDARASALRRVQGSTDYGALRTAQAVIEAATE